MKKETRFAVLEIESRGFARRNILNMSDVDQSTFCAILSEPLRIQFDPYFNRARFYERNIMIGDIERFAVGETNAEWLEWLGIHAFFQHTSIYHGVSITLRLRGFNLVYAYNSGETCD